MAEEGRKFDAECIIGPDGILLVRCPLLVHNGELMAYGVLEKAKHFVEQFVYEADRRHREGGDRIIKPIGPNGGN